MYVDGGLNKGLSNAGIAAAFNEAGGKLDPDVIGRHKKNHWFPPVDPDAPKATQRDLAIMMRDKVAEAIEPMSGDMLLAFGRELAPMVGQGLKAQTMLDRRESQSKKLGLAAGALGFQMYLAGLGRESDPPELEDPTIIEGEAVELP
jgi:hypothetical protein